MIIYGEGKCNPLQYSCLKKPMAEEPLTILGVTRVGLVLAAEQPPPR